MHAVEVALESIDVHGPEAAEGIQPGIELLQGFGPETIEAALGVDGGFDKAGVAQDAEVFGDGRLGQLEATLNVADRLPGGDEQAEDGAAVGLGDDFEDGLHAFYIPLVEYTCQGI